MITIKDAWHFDGQESRVTYVVEHDDGSQRMLWESVTTEWGKELLPLVRPRAEAR